MTLTTGTSRLIMFALLTAGCAPTSGPAGGDGDGDGTTTGNSSDTTTSTAGGDQPADVDNDGIADSEDDFIDLDGNGVDDRDEGTVIDTDGDGHPNCVPGLQATSQVPRLKNTEYDHTIRDLLGLSSLSASNNAPPSSLLATDQGGSISDLGWSSYQTVADMITKQVMNDATLKAKFLLCDPAAADCIASTVTEFGRRAFRRPVRADEAALLRALAVAGNTPNGTPAEVAELLLYGFLISPSFLMRSEMDESQGGAGKYTLSSYEVASRLSYMLWASMPDPALSTAADMGQLATKDQIIAQAIRMLDDDKARTMVAEFHREYLHMGVNTRWDTFVKEPTRFPAYNDGLRPVLTAETEMFFDSIVFGDGGFKDLFLSTKGHVNAETAALYGIDASGLGAELVAKDLPGRPGFLTRLGFLNVFSAASRTSPILRGAFIVKDVLGTNIGTPPPGAGQTELPNTPDLTTNRARVDAQTSDVVCAQCHHEYINPAGFAMEQFDTMGVPQTNEADTGAAIDTNVTLRIDGALVPISNAIEFQTILANSSAASYYYVEKWVSSAFNRPPNSQDACTVEALTQQLSSDGYKILDLIADITQADSFNVRAVDAGVAQ